MMISAKKIPLIATVFILFAYYAEESYSKNNLVGMSRYADLNQDYFVVALHTDEEYKINFYNEIYKRRIEIRIVSEKIFARQFSRIWVNGSAINSKKMDLYQNTENIIEFTKCIKGSLERGDTIIIDYDPSIGTSLAVNGVFIHSFTEPSFFNLLLGVLIGDVPLSTKIKQELLLDTPKKIPKKTVELYKSLSPTESRIAEIRHWAGSSTEDDVLEQKLASTSDKIAFSVAKSKVKKIEKIPTTTKVIAKPAQTKPVKIAAISISTPTPDNNTSKNNPTIENPVIKISKPALKIERPNIEPEFRPFTIESLLAEREFLRVVNDWVGTYSSFPVLVAERPEKDSIRFTITIDKDGQLLNIRQFEKSKYSALNKGAIKLIEKSAPFPKFPVEIQDDNVDLDLYFYLHWRYLR